jgi:hypothetical protein
MVRQLSSQLGNWSGGHVVRYIIRHSNGQIANWSDGGGGSGCVRWLIGQVMISCQ